MCVAVANLQGVAVVVDAEQLHQVGLHFRRRQARDQEAVCRGVVVEVIHRQLAIDQGGVAAAVVLARAVIAQVFVFQFYARGEHHFQRRPHGAVAPIIVEGGSEDMAVLPQVAPVAVGGVEHVEQGLARGGQQAERVALLHVVGQLVEPVEGACAVVETLTIGVGDTRQ